MILLSNNLSINLSINLLTCPRSYIRKTLSINCHVDLLHFDIASHGLHEFILLMKKKKMLLLFLLVMKESYSNIYIYNGTSIYLAMLQFMPSDLVLFVCSVIGTI